MDKDGYSTKIKRDGWIQMDILLKLGQMDILLKLKEMDGYRSYENQDRVMDIDGYSTKIRREGLIQMELGEMDGYSWIFY